MFVCMRIIYVCKGLCVCCLTRWVSWVCWQCLPKLQYGWHFSTNPPSLEGLLITNAQFLMCSLLAIMSERMREKQVHRLYVNSFCACFSHAEIDLLTSCERLHANALATTKFHASSIVPSSLSLSLGLLFSVPLSRIFPPSLCSAALLTSAARKPSVLLSATNRHKQIKKHCSPINSPACLCLDLINWE